MFSIIFKKNKNDINENLALIFTGKYSKYGFLFKILLDNEDLHKCEVEGRNLSSKNNLQMEKDESEGESKLFSVLAGQSAWIKELVFAACDQSWMTLSAEEETVRVSGDGEAWEWPETGGRGFWIDLSWALEADDGLGVALFEQEIGPIASVDFLVVDQTLGAWKLVGDSVFALDVAG